MTVAGSTCTHHSYPPGCSVDAHPSEEHVGHHAGQDSGHCDHYHVQAEIHT